MITLTTGRGYRITHLAVSTAAVIAAATCLITDFAMNRALTWAPIPLLSLLFGWLIASAVLLAPRRKAMAGLAVLTVTVYPYLCALAAAIPAGQWANWPSQLALPLCVLSVPALWLTYALVHWGRLNAPTTAGLIVALFGVGVNLAATAIVGRYTGDAYPGLSDILAAMGAGAAALILLIIGAGKRT